MSELFSVDLPKDNKSEVANIESQTTEVKTPEFLPKSKQVQALMLDPEVISKAETVDLSDTTNLYDIGKEPSDELNQISKKLLNQLTVADTMGSNKTLDALAKITKQIDFKELKPDDYKGLKGLFQKMEDAVSKRIANYTTIGSEVDKLYASLKEYENSTKKNTAQIDELQKANTAYAKNLDQYIALLYILRNKAALEINNTQIAAQNGDEDAQIALPRMKQVAEILDKRTFDLETAKTMAVYTAPQLALTQQNNMSLIDQYHSSFITTIPILNEALAQAIVNVKQNYAQQGLDAHKKATRELMLKSSANINENSIKIAEMGGKQLMSTEDMQQVVTDIQTAVAKTKEIEANNATDREKSRVEMEKIVENFKNANLNNK